MGRIPESIWGTAPYCSGRGGGVSPGPGTARPGPTGRAVAAGAAHVRRWDGRPRGTLVPGFAALSPVVEPGEEHPEVVLRAFADQECIARQAAGLVNQGRGGRPVNIVEHGFVQRCQDALECPGAPSIHRDEQQRGAAVQPRPAAVGVCILEAGGHLLRVRLRPGHGATVQLPRHQAPDVSVADARARRLGVRPAVHDCVRESARRGPRTREGVPSGRRSSTSRA